RGQNPDTLWRFFHSGFRDPASPIIGSYALQLGPIEVFQLAGMATELYEIASLVIRLQPDIVGLRPQAPAEAETEQHQAAGMARLEVQSLHIMGSFYREKLSPSSTVRGAPGATRRSPPMIEELEA